MPRSRPAGSATTPPRTRRAALVSRVLAAALEELAERGWAGLTVEGVAARAGVNKTTIYRRYPTREALVEAALGSTDATGLSVPDTGSLRGDLLALGRMAAAFLSSPTGRAVVRMLFSADDADGGAFGPRVHRDSLQLPRAVLVRARKRGELPASVDGATLLGALGGTILQWTFLDGARVPPRRITALVDLLLDGATASSRRHR